MLSASNFAALIFSVICVFWARITLNEHKSFHCLVAYKMNMLELQSLKSLTWVCFCCCLLQYPVSHPPSLRAFFFFNLGKLRKSNYYLANLFNSKVSDYVSPRKMAECVFKFWMLQLNLAKVHLFAECFQNGTLCFWWLLLEFH